MNEICELPKAKRNYKYNRWKDWIQNDVNRQK